MIPRYSSREALAILFLAFLLGLAVWGAHRLRIHGTGSEPLTLILAKGVETIPKAQDSRPRPHEQERSTLRIDPNRAGEEDLQRLPGIGPVLAARIIRYRERFGSFRDVEDLKKIDGIGEKRFERIRPWIRIQEGKP